MYLCRCRGSLIGTHISSELKFAICAEAAWHQPELVVPSLIHTFRGLHLQTAAIFLNGLTQLCSLKLDVADIDVTYEVTTLQQKEVAVV